MSIPVISGITPKAPKLIIHGLSGAGKSTLAAKLSKPIFLDFEGGLNYIDCVRTPVIEDDRVFTNIVSQLYRDGSNDKREYDTIVIDSIDWAVRRFEEVAAEIITIDKSGKPVKDLKSTLNKANGGYGNGAAYFENIIKSELIPRLSKLNSAGYGICLIAHSELKTLMDADGVSTDRIAPKIHNKVVAPFIEWADDIFYLKKDGDKRILVLDGDDTVLAKNRQGLVGQVSVDEIDINKLLTTVKEK